MDRKEEGRGRLIADIERVFDGVSREDGMTVHEADLEYAGNSEQIRAARAKDTESRWQDVPEGSLRRNFGAPVFIDPKGLRYYIPAFMRFALRYEGVDGRGRKAAVSIATVIAPSEGADDLHWKERVELFGAEERRVICRFLRSMAEGEECGSVSLEYFQSALDLYWGRYCDACG